MMKEYTKLDPYGRVLSRRRHDRKDFLEQVLGITFLGKDVTSRCIIPPLDGPKGIKGDLVGHLHIHFSIQRNHGCPISIDGIVLVQEMIIGISWMGLLRGN